MYTIVLQEILVDRAVHAAASRFVLPPNASLNSVRQSGDGRFCESNAWLIH
jgi:hypothetical protein